MLIAFHSCNNADLGTDLFNAAAHSACGHPAANCWQELKHSSACLQESSASDSEASEHDPRELRAAEGSRDSPADNFPESPEQLDKTKGVYDFIGTHVSPTQAEDAPEAIVNKRAKGGSTARERRQLQAPESQRSFR